MMKRFIALALLVVAIVIQAAPLAANDALDARPADPPWAEVALPLSLNLPLPAESDPHTATTAKLDSALAGLAAVTVGERARSAETGGLRLEDGRVQVQLIINAEDEAAVEQAVVSAGGEVTGSFAGVVQAWLPPEQLVSLAATDLIEYIQPPATAVLAGEDVLAAVTEGVAAANATAWHSAGWRGQSVRIAIIDGGFQGYQSKLGSELPATVTVRNFVDNQSATQVDGTTPHGTACAEIVHDMTPQAELYLLKISTDVDLNEAVDYAISQNVDIISTSLTFINVTPGDGTGRFATMAQKARSSGILWVTAAGNYRETHWAGAFTDTDGDGLHEYATSPETTEVNVFGPGNNTAFLIPAGVSLTPSIRWDDWETPDQDYRLLLLRYNGSAFEIVSSSNNPQSGGVSQRPVERVSYVTSGSAAIYGVAIQRISSDRNVHLHLLIPNRELDRRTPPMSLGNLADVAAVLTVAAVDVQAPFPREDYSSEGPTNGPGGAPAGGRVKPDIAAFANVSTASYGNGRFNGTSAAAPHVAGAAALVLNAYPTALPGEIQDFLASRAIDMGLSGKDAQFGHGRLRLGAPPEPVVYDHFLYLPAVMAKR